MQKSHTKQIHREGGVLANQQHRTRGQIFGKVHVRQQRRLRVLHSLWRSYGVGLTQKYKLGVRVHIVINDYYYYFLHLLLILLSTICPRSPVSSPVPGTNEPLWHCLFCFFSVYLARKGIFFQAACEIHINKEHNREIKFHIWPLASKKQFSNFPMIYEELNSAE